MTKNSSTAASDATKSSVDLKEQASTPELASHVAQDAVAPKHGLPSTPARESGGQAGPEPTRYGDWEKKGRCTDF